MWQLTSGVLGASGLIINPRTDPTHAGLGVAGTQYDSVYGRWTVPATSCSVHENSEVSAWLGLGGLSDAPDDTLEQIGTDTSCNNGAAQYYAWWEMVPPGSQSCPAYPSPEPSGSSTPPGCPQLIPSRCILAIKLRPELATSGVGLTLCFSTTLPRAGQRPWTKPGREMIPRTHEMRPCGTSRRAAELRLPDILLGRFR